MGAHLCHALGCAIRTPPEMLMCKRHWFMVPQGIRNTVWSNYRNGQCDTKTPSVTWCRAADAAVAAVAKLEGKNVNLGKTFTSSFHPKEP